MSKQNKVEIKVREIRRKTRKRYSAEEKIRIVLEGIRGEERLTVEKKTIVMVAIVDNENVVIDLIKVTTIYPTDFLLLNEQGRIRHLGHPIYFPVVFPPWRRCDAHRQSLSSFQKVFLLFRRHHLENWHS